eukprot:s830_g11.t1
MNRDRLRRDAITYHACIMSCEKSLQWQRALGWFAEMHQKRLEHNSNTFNAVVSSCEQSGQWPAANQKFGPECSSKNGSNAKPGLLISGGTIPGGVAKLRDGKLRTTDR